MYLTELTRVRTTLNQTSSTAISATLGERKSVWNNIDLAGKGYSCTTRCWIFRLLVRNGDVKVYDVGHTKKEEKNVTVT